MTECDCGAVDDGKWAGKHSTGCAYILGLCKNCDGERWVCENHLGKPWKGMSSREDACDCGAGAPCPICNWDMAVAGTFDQGRTAGLRLALEINSVVDLKEDVEKEIAKALKNWNYKPPDPADYS